MIRIKGRYRNQRLELDQPLNLPEGEEVEVEIHPVRSEAEGWRELGMERLAQRLDALAA